MNVTGKIILNANDFLTNFEKASSQKKAGLKKIEQNLSKLKGVRVKISKKDVVNFKKIDAPINEICRETVQETANYVRGEVYRRTYVAPKPYMRYGVEYAPNTLAKRSYSFLLPKAECPKNVHIAKVSFINNKETGWFGEVAVLWEYGSSRTPAQPMMRPALKMADEIFKNGLQFRLNKMKKIIEKQ